MVPIFDITVIEINALQLNISKKLLVNCLLYDEQ